MNESIRWQLINATVNCDSQRLRSLLSNRVRIDLIQACQLFHLAATCGSTEILNILLAFKPSINVNSRDEVGCTAIHKAASAGHREILHFLIYHGGRIDAQEFIHGNSALHEASSRGFSRSVEALCILRAAPNLQNKLGLTALHVAAQHGHKQCIRILLSSGADIGATDRLGNTCLHTAVAYGRASIVKLLLAASANVMATNSNLDTPLHIAASLKHTKIARCLLNAVGRRGSNSVTGSLTNSNGGGFRKRTLALSSPLSAEHAALWMRNAQGNTPLDIAKLRIRSNDRGGSSNMITLIFDWMNEAGRCTQTEQGFSKVLDRFSIGSEDKEAKGSDSALTAPFISANLMYPSVYKKKGFTLVFKNRKLPKKETSAEYYCNGLSNKQIRQDLRPSDLISTPSVDSDQQSSQINAAQKITAPLLNASTVENPAQFPNVVKTKSRIFGRNLFKRERDKTVTPKMFGTMKKSESSQLHQPGVSRLSASTKMPPSISLPGPLNESQSSSLAGTSIVQDASLSVDDPVQSSLLLSRFQQLPFPEDSENTSAGVSSAQLLEDATASSLSDCDRSMPHPSISLCSQSIVHPQLSVGAGEGSSGSGERTRPRLGVRFDLDGCGEARITPASVLPNQQNSFERPPNGHRVQPSLAHGEGLQKTNFRHDMSRSKSYNDQMATSVAAKTKHFTDGGLFDSAIAGKSPLYMSCHNIDGKMGLSVGHLSRPIPTNGA